MAVRLQQNQQVNIDKFAEGLRDEQPAAFYGIMGTTTAHVLLDGAGGTGKTFVLVRALQAFQEQGYTIAAIAPTHKAKNVMQEMGAKAGLLGIEYVTLASVLKFKPGRDLAGNKTTVDNKKSKRPELKDFDVAWIDECGMIKGYELDKIFSQPTRKLIIYTGDRLQFAPYGEKASPVFERVVESYSLTKIQRYDGVIAVYAERLRQDIKAATIPPIVTNWDDSTRMKGIAKYTDSDTWLKMIGKAFSSDDYKEDTSFAKVIAYRNDKVRQINGYIRNAMHASTKFNLPEFLDGDRIAAKSAIFKFSGTKMQYGLHLEDRVDNIKSDLKYRSAIQSITQYYYDCFVALEIDEDINEFELRAFFQMDRLEEDGFTYPSYINSLSNLELQIEYKRVFEKELDLTPSPILSADEDVSAQDYMIAVETQKELSVLSATTGTRRLGDLIIKHWVLDCLTDDGQQIELTPVHVDSIDALTDYLEALWWRLKKQETDMQWAQWESILYDYHLVDKEIQNKKTKEVTGIGFESAITHAFCITAFQAQGSGWDNCFIDLADMNVLLKVGDGTIEEKRESRNRAVYVAMSRAKKRIFALI